MEQTCIADADEVVFESFETQEDFKVEAVAKSGAGRKQWTKHVKAAR